MLKAVFSEERIEEALNYLRGKKDGCGSDGVMLHDLTVYLTAHDVIGQVLDGSYAPRPALELEISSKSGKQRTVYLKSLRLLSIQQKNQRPNRAKTPGSAGKSRSISCPDREAF